jgi:GDP-L-fucose synthase
MNLNKKKYDKQVTKMCSHLNVGSGKELSIKDLAYIIKNIVGYKGKIIFDITKPEGNPRKLLNTSRINNLGFKARISLKNGLAKTYKEFLRQL